MPNKRKNNIFLEKDKEIVDAEILVILKAFVITGKMVNFQILITILSDFQKALKAIALSFTFQENCFQRSQMRQKMEEL